MLVTGSGLLSLCHTKFVIVPSQDSVNIVVSVPDQSSNAIDVILMMLDIRAIRENGIALGDPILQPRVADLLEQRQVLTTDGQRLGYRI
jgi:hypothetical protein